MKENEDVVRLRSEIRGLLGHNKKVMIVDDLAAYTGLSKSKIYKLTYLKLIPMGNNRHIRQKFFDKDAIDVWLLEQPDFSDKALEHLMNQKLMITILFHLSDYRTFVLLT